LKENTIPEAVKEPGVFLGVHGVHHFALVLHVVGFLCKQWAFLKYT
jgi:hypothetical protein